MAITFESRQAGPALVISCHGHIVFGPEAVALRDEVKNAFERSRHIILDLSGVQYVDSGGLGAIVGLFSSAHATGGSLKIAGMNERVRHVFHITKLLSILEVHDTVEEAVAAAAHAA